MKKFYSILTLIIFILPCMFLFSCSKTTDNSDTVVKPEFTKVKLTLDNVLDYICINSYYTDPMFDKISDDYGISKYNLSCFCHIETSRKQDCYFENVKITYLLKLPSTWQSGTITSSIDYLGNSHSSFSTYKENTYILDFLDSLNISNTNLTSYVSAISGYALIPEN